MTASPLLVQLALQPQASPTRTSRRNFSAVVVSSNTELKRMPLPAVTVAYVRSLIFRRKAA